MSTRFALHLSVITAAVLRVHTWRLSPARCRRCAYRRQLSTKRKIHNDESSRFLRNVGYVPNYTATHTSISSSSYLKTLQPLNVTFQPSLPPLVISRLRCSGYWSHGTSVGIAASMWAGRSGVPVPAEARHSFLFQKTQTYCGAHPASVRRRG